MSIYKSAVNNPISTMMVFVGVIVLGIYSLTKLPVDLYPEMDPPYISVITTYAGANASDIENNITKRMEDALNSVDKLKEIKSVSYDNMSMVSLEFEWDANLDEASNDIRDAIDRVLDYLPDGADRPSIFKFNTSMIPIIFYAITANESYPGLAKIIDDKVVNPLNRIDGIGSISLIGAPSRKIYVDLDAKLMDANHITLEQVGSVVAAENLNVPAGNVKMGLIDYQLRIQGEFADSRELNDLVVGNYNGKTILLKDIAQVRDTIKDISLDERIDGKPGVRMFVMKQSGANTVRIAKDVKKMMVELKQNLPPDIKIEEIVDTSKFISDSVSNLSETILYALLFVVLVVFAFLGRWRATIIIVLTIPISLIVAFIYLFITDSSLNIISLTSLSIAIGMVVDDAIVVLENITKHIERGASPREAAIFATNEVWLSVIVTTAVIVAVFMPLTMVSGMTGVLFKELGWIVTITVVVSTIAAITLTPMLSSKLLRIRSKDKVYGRFSYKNTMEKWLDKLDIFYEKTIRWSLRNKKKVAGFSFLIFFASFGLMKFIGTDFMPEADESRIAIAVELQTGLRVEESSKVARRIEAIIDERYPEVILTSSSTGADEEGSMTSLFSSTGTNLINIMLKLTDVDKRERSVWDIAEDIRQQLYGIAEITNLSVTTASQGFGGSGNNVDVEIYGFDFNQTSKVAQEIKERVSHLKGARDIQISRKADKPEFQIVLDKQKLALHGLSSAAVSSSIRNRVDGMEASKFREEGEEYDIIVRFAEKYRESISDINNITITTPQGKQLKLQEIGEVKEYWGPPNIEHKRKERIVTVSVKPVGVSLGDMASAIKQELKKVEIPQNVLVNVGGAYQDQMESFQDLAMLLLLSLVLVFLVMASQFESFVMPFVIMFSIPFAFTGVILALFLTSTSLSVVAALGAVLLVGIVVKNGIVLVDYINLMRDRGYELHDAIALSGRSRLRPVLMTALTTILGMLPMAISTGEGSEIWRPMGITVIGGLVVSTVITMIIVPVMYSVLAKHGERDKKKKVRALFAFMND